MANLLYELFSTKSNPCFGYKKKIMHTLTTTSSGLPLSGLTLNMPPLARCSRTCSFRTPPKMSSTQPCRSYESLTHPTPSGGGAPSQVTFWVLCIGGNVIRYLLELSITPTQYPKTSVYSKIAHSLGTCVCCVCGRPPRSPCPSW